MEENPFADPSMQQARTGGGAAGTVRTDGLDNYNPFAGGQGRQAAGSTGGQQQQPAVLPPSSDQPPSGATVGVADLERRQRELDTKAADLDRREREQRHLLDQGKAAGGGANNWPPLPSFCPVQPCFYQDFEVEIAIEFRSIVRTGYYLWMAHATVMLLNILGSLSYFIGSEGSSKGGTQFGMSIVLFFIFTPASFICWYRPLYKAFRSDSSFNFFVFFFIFFAQFVVLVIQCLGIDWLASCGWINSLGMIKGNVVVAAIMIIIASFFTLLAVLDMLLLIKVHRLYRSTGASMEKARQEFNQGVMANQTVRNTAADFGTAAARGAVSGATSGNRY